MNNYKKPPHFSSVSHSRNPVKSVITNHACALDTYALERRLFTYICTTYVQGLHIHTMTRKEYKISWNK